MTGTIATLTSSDGLHRIDFDQSTDGLVRFTELVLRREQAPWDPNEVDGYWGSGVYSGLYASLEEAQAYAKSELPWYRAETSRP